MNEGNSKLEPTGLLCIYPSPHLNIQRLSEGERHYFSLEGMFLFLPMLTQDHKGNGILKNSSQLHQMDTALTNTHDIYTGLIHGLVP